MQRVPQQPRPNWRQRLDDVGFTFHSIDPDGIDRARETDRFLYWREDVAYRFTEHQVEAVHDATRELHAMLMDLAGDLIRRGDLQRLALPEIAAPLIEASWARGDPHLYGRLDLAWDGGRIKLLEANYDTPTSIIETAVAQWTWLQDAHPGGDQFNSLHEALIARWPQVAAHHGAARVHLACVYDSQEDVGNTEYLMDTVLQAGLQATLTEMAAIGLTADGQFVDGDDRPIALCFKLYPWEHMVAETYGPHVGAAATRWVEPAWKMALSTKAVLPLLWERHRGHPHLLAASFEPGPLADRPHVRKPLLSREGANIRVSDGTRIVEETAGPYGAEGFVYQALCPLPSFPAPETTSWHGPRDAVHAVIGSWVVADDAVGLCVREDVSAVTTNTAYFVPHHFT